MTSNPVDEGERVECLLCRNKTNEEDRKVPVEDLKEHIAESHFFHSRHKCCTCRMRSFEVEKMIKHALTEPTHRVLLNKAVPDGYKDQLVVKIYDDCIMVHESKVRVKQDGVDQPVTSLQEQSVQQGQTPTIVSSSSDSRPVPSAGRAPSVVEVEEGRSAPVVSFDFSRDKSVKSPLVIVHRSDRPSSPLLEMRAVSCVAPMPSVSSSVDRPPVEKTADTSVGVPFNTSSSSEHSRRSHGQKEARGETGGGTMKYDESIRLSSKCDVCDEVLRADGSRNLSGAMVSHVSAKHFPISLRCPMWCGYVARNTYQAAFSAIGAHVQGAHRRLTDEAQQIFQGVKADKRAELYRSIATYFPTFESPEGEVNSSTIILENSDVRYLLRVENLTSHYTSKDLEELMRFCGPVAYATAHHSARNVGEVYFKSHDDLLKAIEKYQGFSINGRAINLVDAGRGDRVKIQSASFNTSMPPSKSTGSRKRPGSRFRNSDHPLRRVPLSSSADGAGETASVIHLDRSQENSKNGSSEDRPNDVRARRYFDTADDGDDQDGET